MPRRPWLAALLSLVEIGLGDAYNGQAAKGVRLVAIGWLCLFVGAVGFATTTAFARSRLMGLWILFMFVPTLLLRLWGIVRAWRDARRLGESPEPRRSWVTVGAFAVGMPLIGLALALVVRTCFVQAYRMPSGSMQPTLRIGENFMANKLLYGATVLDPTTRAVRAHLPGVRHPQPGDVVVFVYPRERDKELVKRVVAVGGETVELRGTSLLVDGVVRDEPYARYGDNPRGELMRKFGPFRVPDGHVFVLGDNRDESYDSRFWGPVPEADVLGRAEMIYGVLQNERARWVLGPVID
jgi:signal peptidase I